MTPKWFRNGAAIAAALLPLFCTPVGATGSAGELQVVGPTGKTLIALPVNAGEQWCLLWNHSVAGFVVSDCFSNDSGVMKLQSSHQPDFAAGLGDMEGRGTVVADPRGGYLITDIGEPIPDNSLVVRLGSLAVDHRLLYRGKEISLSSLAAGQRTTLRLSAH